VQLVYFEGLGLADVARLQDVPENTVKTRLFHARKNVRSCVEQVGISSAG
jgi:RNA polymerase sigma-70 factor (ECF subfamily)